MDNRTEKRRIGDLGESLAGEWLKKQGYRVLDRNYLTKVGEIDIVGIKDKKITFFEVKTVTRKTPRPFFDRPEGWPDDVSRESRVVEEDYEPEDNIHPWKLKRLARTIEIYLSDKNIDEEDVDWQLDSLAVYLDQEENLVQIQHLEDIF